MPGVMESGCSDQVHLYLCRAREGPQQLSDVLVLALITTDQCFCCPGISTRAGVEEDVRNLRTSNLRR